MWNPWVLARFAEANTRLLAAMKLLASCSPALHRQRQKWHRYIRGQNGWHDEIESDCKRHRHGLKILFGKLFCFWNLGILRCQSRYVWNRKLLGNQNIMRNCANLSNYLQNTYCIFILHIYEVIWTDEPVVHVSFDVLPLSGLHLLGNLFHTSHSTNGLGSWVRCQEMSGDPEQRSKHL